MKTIDEVITLLQARYRKEKDTSCFATLEHAIAYANWLEEVLATSLVIMHNKGITGDQIKETTNVIVKELATVRGIMENCPYCKREITKETKVCPDCLAKRINPGEEWFWLSDFEQQSGWIAFFTNAKQKVKERLDENL